MKLLLALLLVIAARLAGAFDIDFPNGTSFRDVKITAVEADGLRFTHSTGTGRLTYEQLPPELQKQYFDPAKIAALRAQEAAAREVVAQKARAERKANEERIASERAEKQLKELENFKAGEAARAAKQKAAEEKAAAEAQAKTNASIRFGLLMAGAALLYFLPTLIALFTVKSNFLAIAALNLLLGWTFVGWVVSLVWSLSRDTEKAIRSALADKDRAEAARHRIAQRQNETLIAALLAKQTGPPKPKVIEAKPVPQPKVLRGSDEKHS